MTERMQRVWEKKHLKMISIQLLWQGWKDGSAISSDRDFRRKKQIWRTRWWIQFLTCWEEYPTANWRKQLALQFIGGELSRDSMLERWISQYHSLTITLYLSRFSSLVLILPHQQFFSKISNSLSLPLLPSSLSTLISSLLSLPKHRLLDLSL